MQSSCVEKDLMKPVSMNKGAYCCLRVERRPLSVQHHLQQLRLHASVRIIWDADNIASHGVHCNV